MREMVVIFVISVYAGSPQKKHDEISRKSESVKGALLAFFTIFTEKQKNS